MTNAQGLGGGRGSEWVSQGERCVSPVSSLIPQAQPTPHGRDHAPRPASQRYPRWMIPTPLAQRSTKGHEVSVLAAGGGGNEVLGGDGMQMSIA